MESKKPSRRKFLKGGAEAAVAGLAVGAIGSASAQTIAPDAHPPKPLKDLVAYGERSRFVTSVRVPVAERESPDQFGLTFHVLSPLQDSVGIITPSSLHFVGTHRGAIVPDIDPKEHRLMIHGMVDRPLEFTMEELRRFPSVSRIHFLECLGNRSRPEYKTVQETHGLTSCSEWTGVPLSLLLKEVGVQKGASWVVSEGSEEVKGAGSIRLAKAMDDCIVAYGQNGEPLRPQQGFPIRLLVPGFEGIYNTKWLRRIKVVDRYYMTYNDYGHISKDEEVAALTFQWGPKSVITFPSGGQQLPGHGIYQITGLAWSGGGCGSQGGNIHRRRPDLEGCRDSGAGASQGAHPIWLELEVGRTRVRAAIALHRRTGPGATVSRSTRQILQRDAGVLPHTRHPGFRQHYSTVASGRRRERPQCARLGFSCR